jgi:hypothetical protein
MASPIIGKIEQVADLLALNIMTIVSTVMMVTSKETITWVISCMVGLTVAWFNVERAINTRKERKIKKNGG